MIKNIQVLLIVGIIVLIVLVFIQNQWFKTNTQTMKNIAKKWSSVNTNIISPRWNRFYSPYWNSFENTYDYPQYSYNNYLRRPTHKHTTNTVDVTITVADETVDVIVDGENIGVNVTEENMEVVVDEENIGEVIIVDEENI